MNAAIHLKHTIVGISVALSQNISTSKDEELFLTVDPTLDVEKFSRVTGHFVVPVDEYSQLNIEKQYYDEDKLSSSIDDTMGQKKIGKKIQPIEKLCVKVISSKFNSGSTTTTGNLTEYEYFKCLELATKASISIRNSIRSIMKGKQTKELNNRVIPLLL